MASEFQDQAALMEYVQKMEELYEATQKNQSWNCFMKRTKKVERSLKKC